MDKGNDSLDRRCRSQVLNGRPKAQWAQGIYKAIHENNWKEGDLND
jgi:hypothetical protein